MLHTPSASVAEPAGSTAVLPRPRLTSAFAKTSHIPAVVVRALLRVADAATIALSGVVLAYLWVDRPDVTTPAYGLAIAAAALGTVGIMEAAGIYAATSFNTLMRLMPRVIASWVAGLAVVVAGVFFLKIGADVSRVWIAAWLLIGGVGLTLERLAAANVLRQWAAQGRLARRAVIYGTGPLCEQIAEALEGDSEHAVDIVGVFDDRGTSRAPAAIRGVPRLGGLDDLVTCARQMRVDTVLLALPITAEERINTLMRTLNVLPADIRMPAQASRLRFTARTYSRLGSAAVIDLRDRPMSDWGPILKGAFDRVVGLLALLLLAPVMVTTALLVKLDSRGPVLFRQKRYGFNNELIEVFKFRSMYVDQCDVDARRLVTKDDPRVTRIGRFIRKTSLDELPQLLNVLNGTLSLVGPRPHAVQAKAGDRLYDQAVDGYFARHKVKPGITGWAQINGWRGETDTLEKIQKRVEHDLYYIENWSIFLDIYILAKTPFALIKDKNAY